MLIAEIHGIYVPEARNSEDYLTSAVFGDLRYVPPGAFWEILFQFATSETLDSKQITASEYIRETSGRSIGDFETLDMLFWPKHKNGVPDLVLHFSGTQARPVVILIEAKLNAMKSGVGEYDQLARYLRVLDSLDALQPSLPSDALTLAVYLTAVDSRTEVLESLKEYGDSEPSRQRLYQLRWQDLIQAIDRTQPSSAIENLILRDVRAFLRKRDLEYFSGMGDTSYLPDVTASDGDFLIGDPLFETESIPTDFMGIDERWIHGD